MPITYGFTSKREIADAQPSLRLVSVLKFNEADHPRQQSGSTRGQFVSAGGGTGRSGSVIIAHAVGKEHESITTTPEGKMWIDKYRRGLIRENEGLPGGKQNPIHCGNDLEKAQRLVGMGKHITLNQPDQVATLVSNIKRDMDAAAAKEKETGVKVKMPIFNIAGISVPGTNLFAQDNLDIDRVYMPQLGGIPDPNTKADKEPKNSRGGVDLTDHFMQHLANRGVNSTTENRLASHMRATQDGLDGEKVGGIAQAMRDGKMEEGYITVTRDGYILDGHHRWAATIVNDIADNTLHELRMPVKVLDIDIGTALSMAREFQEDWGLPVAKFGQKKRDYTLLLQKQEKYGDAPCDPDKKKKKKKPHGMQEVPMNLDAIKASLAHANS